MKHIAPLTQRPLPALADGEKGPVTTCGPLKAILGKCPRELEEV